MVDKYTYDFGFSTHSEDEFKETKSKATEMYDLIEPLLLNLKKNPEKEIIKWPNREKSINEFMSMLKKIRDR